MTFARRVLGTPSIGLVLAAVLLATLSIINASACRAADASANIGDAGPFAAHNAYPYRLYAPKRFERALDAGLKYVELDITYDPKRKVAVVTHDGTPRGGETELSTMLDQLWSRWMDAPEGDYTVILDFKTSSPELVQAVQDLLTPQAEHLSKMKKEAGAKFQPGEITVCLTGDKGAHRIFEEAVADGDDYLAFGDGGAGGWLENASDHVPDEPAGFVRFLTYHFSAFAEAPKARGLEHFSEERAREVMEKANAGDYRVRIYTLNPPRGEDRQRDYQSWERCVNAGVHMIATDNYADARKWWEARNSQ